MMCLNSAKKSCVNRTKLQIKLLVDRININNNSEVYLDLQYLLNKLKAENLPKLRYNLEDAAKSRKGVTLDNKELLDKTGLWIYSSEYYQLLLKYPKVAKWYKDLFGNIPYKDCKCKITYQLILDLDAYNAIDGLSEVIDLMKLQYAYIQFNKKYPSISSAYFMRKVKVHRLQSKLLIDLHIEFIAKLLLSKQLDIYILAELIEAIMNDIGDSYTQILPDGTILIMNSNFLPLIKVYNQKNAQHYVAPIKVYYKGEVNGEKTSRHIAIV